MLRLLCEGAILEAENREILGERFHGLCVTQREERDLGQDVARNEVDLVEENQNNLLRHFFGDGLLDGEAAGVLRHNGSTAIR